MRNIWEFSVLSLHLFYKSESVLKLKILFWKRRRPQINHLVQPPHFTEDETEI